MVCVLQSCIQNFELSSRARRTVGEHPNIMWRASIGNRLKREHNLAEWGVVNGSLVSELVRGEELGGLNRILWLSYEDLPHHLKPCYLYFGMFPEDYLVNRGLLTRQLVAEGFIVPIAGNNRVNLEESAKGYIHQLVSQNLT